MHNSVFLCSMKRFFSNMPVLVKRPIHYVVFIITFILATIIPCFAGSILVTTQEREYEATIVSYFYHHAPSWVTMFSRMLAIIFSTKITIGILLILAVISLLTYRNWRITLAQLLIALLPMVYIFAVKFAVHRDRPNIGIRVPLPPDPSFPSGHTAAAIAVGTMITLMIYVTHPLLAQVSILCSGLVTILVGISRLVVAAHFPTDVLASAIIYPLIATSLLFLFQRHDLYITHNIAIPTTVDDNQNSNTCIN